MHSKYCLQYCFQNGTHYKGPTPYCEQLQYSLLSSKEKVTGSNIHEKDIIEGTKAFGLRRDTEEERKYM